MPICDCCCESDGAQKGVAIEDLSNVMYLLSCRLVLPPEGLWSISLTQNGVRPCTKLTDATGFLLCVPYNPLFSCHNISNVPINRIKLGLYFCYHFDCRKICRFHCLLPVSPLGAVMSVFRCLYMYTCFVR
jgi:hypothetical protein